LIRIYCGEEIIDGMFIKVEWKKSRAEILFSPKQIKEIRIFSIFNISLLIITNTILFYEL